jgi:CBS domain-containing protein
LVSRVAGAARIHFPIFQEFKMKAVSKIMTRGVRTMAPGDSVVRAAQLMEELNVGAIPVCEGQRLVGMLTDRDIVVRGVALGLGGQGATLAEIMSRDVKSCLEEESVDDVLNTMSIHQIRRMPVVDKKQQLVGIVSLGDIAARVRDLHVAESLGEISETQEQHRAGMLPVKTSSGDGSAASRSARRAS